MWPKKKNYYNKALNVKAKLLNSYRKVLCRISLIGSHLDLFSTFHHYELCLRCWPMQVVWTGCLKFLFSGWVWPVERLGNTSKEKGNEVKVFTRLGLG